MDILKKLLTLSFALVMGYSAAGQEYGNANYAKIARHQYLDNGNFSIPTPIEDIVLNVNGIANVKADSYVAIVSITQMGKTAEEVNTIMDKRIEEISKELKTHKEIEVFVDMISFVPTYEFEVEKKVFSKKTYNEIPAGFELKKNLHIRYNNPQLLNTILNVLSKNEVYDLARVHHVSSQIENIKRELMTKAIQICNEKIKNYELFIGQSLANAPKNVSDGYKTVLPSDRYDAYEAYNTSSLQIKRGTINHTEKNTTYYYLPILGENFDFVINPDVLQPVIQIMYQVRMVIQRGTKETQLVPNKEFFIVKPDGELQKLDLR